MFSQTQLFSDKGIAKYDRTDIYLLEANQIAIKNLSQNREETVLIKMPIGQKGIQSISLTKTPSISQQTTFVARHEHEDETIQNLDIIHYSGHVIGSKQSLVSLSISNNEILALISFDNQNWNLTKSKESNTYELFHDDSVGEIFDIKICASKDDQSFYDQQHRTNAHYGKSNSSMSSVDVYVACDYQMFTDFGSDITTTLNYATSLLNTVNTIFNMSNINLNFTQIDVWTTPDPYDANNADSASDVLNGFKCDLDGVYNGRIAQLISTTNQFGGLANVRDQCPYEEPLYGFSRIFSSFNTDLNIYSWSVGVIAHEIGHNLSSAHTHSCAWNGNNTQIDDCANVFSTSNDNDSDCDGVIDNVEEAAGSDCFDILNPIIPAKGTIMSYCHLSTGNGVDLSLGFHPQVGQKMKDYIDNCLSPSTVIYCPMPHEADLIVIAPEPNQLELTCTITNEIDGYAWNIKPNYSCSQDTTIVTTSNSIVYYDDSTLGADYIVKCLLNCVTGPEWGEWSCEVHVESPTCYTHKILSGIQSDVLKIDKASDFIQSTELIKDNSRISYQIANQIRLMPSFEVQKGSILEVLLISCL